MGSLSDTPGPTPGHGRVFSGAFSLVSGVDAPSARDRSLHRVAARTHIVRSTADEEIYHAERVGAVAARTCLGSSSGLRLRTFLHNTGLDIFPNLVLRRRRDLAPRLRVAEEGDQITVLACDERPPGLVNSGYKSSRLRLPLPASLATSTTFCRCP